MKRIFPGYHRPTKDEFEKLWQTCTFVLDANVLLNLYRYPEQARKDLLKVLNKVRDRIWIPYQAALEFERNRLIVIAEQTTRFSDVRKLLQEVESKLNTGLEGLQLSKRHSSIKPELFLEKASKLFSEFNDQLEQLEKSHADVFGEDKLRGEIIELVQGRIGDPPKSQEELDSIYRDGEIRYVARVPPGYLDSPKAKSIELDMFSYGGLMFRRSFGDLILWKQVIRRAKDAQLKALVIVTDDKKEDWWLIVDSKGPKTIGPRPELAEEIVRESGVELFYIYDSVRFLEYARQFLSVGVKEESVNAVKEVAEDRKQKIGALARAFQVEGAVENWLRSLYPDATIEAGKGVPDFIVTKADGQRTGYEVKFLGVRGSMAHILYNTVSTARAASESTPKLSDVTIVFVFEDQAVMADLILKLQGATSKLKNLGRGLVTCIVIGGLTESSDEDKSCEFLPAWKQML